jgi:hypothetical protein
MLKEVDERRHPDVTEAPISNRTKRLARLVGWGALIMVVLLAAYGSWRQIEQSQAALETLEHSTNEIPAVRTSLVETVTGARRLDLPGTTSPFDSAMWILAAGLRKATFSLLSLPPISISSLPRRGRKSRR